MSHRIYVGTIGQGVMRSLDGGETFSRAMDGMFVECHVRALAVHPHDDRVLYLGCELGLFRSQNGADDWQRVESPANDKQIWSILLHPRRPETIVVGACPSRIFVSHDAGKSWREAITDIRPDCPRIMHTRVTTLKADPDNDEAIWAGVEIDGIHRSDDGGRSFRRTSGTGLLSQDIHDLLFLRHAGQRALLAATNADLHRSTDDGRTWQPLTMKRLAPWQYCRALGQPVGQANVALLGFGNGPPGSEGSIARSEDGGANWQLTSYSQALIFFLRYVADDGEAKWQLTSFPGWGNSTIWNFAVHAAEPKVVYANSISGQLYRSTDGGLGWTKLAREFGEIRALAWTGVGAK